MAPGGEEDVLTWPIRALVYARPSDGEKSGFKTAIVCRASPSCGCQGQDYIKIGPWINHVKVDHKTEVREARAQYGCKQDPDNGGPAQSGNQTISSPVFDNHFNTLNNETSPTTQSQTTMTLTTPFDWALYQGGRVQAPNTGFYPDSYIGSSHGFSAPANFGSSSMALSNTTSTGQFENFQPLYTIVGSINNTSPPTWAQECDQWSAGDERYGDEQYGNEQYGNIPLYTHDRYVRDPVFEVGERLLLLREAFLTTPSANHCLYTGIASLSIRASIQSPGDMYERLV
ncbi:hypothetical protein GGR51DRAFT_538960 [Nemania sp. FL0031]|nr:hypothetical protein GGR51DRAFT_538960 [Nemania sp. FL0031]